MQSFLQYRRFGRHVRAQYERDQEKAKAQALNGNETSTSVSPSSSAQIPSLTHNDTSMDVRDPEKAEHVTDGGAAPLQKELSAEESLPAEEAFDHAQEGQDPLSSVTTTRSKQSMGTALGTALTGIEVRKRSTKEGGEGNVFVVGYEGEKDIMNPHNWSRATRIGAT